MNTRDAATHGNPPFTWARDHADTGSLSVRDWLAHLAKTGRVATIDKPVALEHELAAIAKRLDGEQAAFFTHPHGHAIPVVSGFMSKRAWIAEAMGVDESALLARFSAAAAAPLASKLIQREDAPCQQVVYTSGIDLHAMLPIPTHSEHDNGPYITAGLVIARNPRTGVQNVSINRIQVHGPDRMAILLLPRHLYALQRDAEAAGDALDVAIVIGVDPLTMLASQAITPIDHDELEIAGALHGAPLPVARCMTNGVHVPAFAEIVIEGRILPNVREPEGPFGEFPKYYSAKEAREVIEVTAVTHRRDVDAAGDHWLHVTGKGGKPARVTLTPLARAALDRYLQERGMPVSRAHWNPATPLIGSLDDGDAGIKPLRLWEVMRRFFRHAAQIIEKDHPALAEKLRQATPHWMRHTHATHALAKGVELSAVRDNLRHASISTTSIYLHADDVKRARQFGQAFTG